MTYIGVLVSSLFIVFSILITVLTISYILYKIQMYRKPVIIRERKLDLKPDKNHSERIKEEKYIVYKERKPEKRVYKNKYKKLSVEDFSMYMFYQND